VKTADVCRKNDIGSATFFKWKSEYTWFGPQSPEPTVRNSSPSRLSESGFVV
jgi:hypothetical protein